MSHSFIAPSSADVWVHCAGSPLLSTLNPQEDTEAAKEGEASHWVVAHGLGVRKVEQGRSFRELPDNPADLIGIEAPNGVIITEEMVECAEVMIDDVLENTTKAAREASLTNGYLHVEEDLEIKHIHDQCHGTPDVWMFNGTIRLWDYKFGHKDVPADSWQNKCYIAGILDRLNINGDVKVIMTIVQPRSFSEEGPIKRYECMASDLRADFNLLASQAEKAYLPDPGVVSGPWCRYCPARHACPAAREAATSAVEYAGSALPEILSNDALSFELALLDRGLKAIEYRYDAIKTFALTQIDAGQMIPGFGTTPSYGNRKFTVPNDELFTMGDILGVETRGVQKTITPAEFDRRLKTVNKQRKVDGLDPIDTSVINGYVERPLAGMKLVPSEEVMAIKAFKAKGNI